MRARKTTLSLTPTSHWPPSFSAICDFLPFPDIRSCASGRRHRPGLEFAQRRPEAATLTSGRVDAEAFPHAAPDAELQFRVGLGRIVRRGLEKLVRQSQFQDRPERLHVLP